MPLFSKQPQRALRPIFISLGLALILPACSEERVPLTSGSFKRVFPEERTSDGELAPESSSGTGDPSTGDTTSNASSSGGTAETGEGSTQAPGSADSTGSGSPEQAAGDQTRPVTMAVHIHLEKNSVDFVKGTTVVQTVGLKRRDSDAWHEGCPRFVGEKLLEVADLDVPMIEFDGVVVNSPVLMATCVSPDWNHYVILRSANSMPTESRDFVGCEEQEACLRFQRYLLPLQP